MVDEFGDGILQTLRVGFRADSAIVELNESTNLLSLSTTIHSMTLKLDELLHKFSTPDSPQHSSSSSIAIPTPTSPSSAHRLKLEVLHFDRLDLMGWIFKITQFFKYHTTPDHKCLTIASFYTDDKAFAWFQWMTRNGQLTSWPVFL